MNVTDDIIDALDDDGDEVEVGRYTVRLHIEPDETSYFTDIAEMGDVYGHTAYVDAMRTNNYGHAMRPLGFDGSARKLQLRSSQIWWQPPDDIRGDPAAIREMASLVRDLCEYGFTSVGLTVHETITDSLGRSHRVEVISAWLGGIDTIEDLSYKRSIIEDLFLDLPTLP